MRFKKAMKRNARVKRNGLSDILDTRTKSKYLLFLMLLLIVIGTITYAVSTAVRSAFLVNRVIFTGNTHLSDEELKNLAGLKGSEGLLSISSGRMYEKLIASPWIRSASIRKEFPDKLHILIREAEPFALLDLKDRLFIVDDKGRMLEELKNGSMPFLPVISSNPFGEKEVFYDAIHLAAVIKKTGLLSRKDHIEIIAHKPNEVALNLDGVVVKIGVGEYEEKLARLTDLEEDIRSRGIPVDYIDLRYENRVIVKPINEVIK
jgi:cell division protein FtsQ